MGSRSIAANVRVNLCLIRMTTTAEAAAAITTPTNTNANVMKFVKIFYPTSESVSNRMKRILSVSALSRDR